jgi:hypothetical protein
MRREPFTVRLPSDLASSVRERGNTHPRGTAGLVEMAVRLYLASQQADQERAALLSSVEEALLERLDKRLGRAVEGLRDIAAKANYDQSLTLLLVHETLETLFANDRQTLHRIYQGARQEAAQRLRRASALSPEAEAEAVTMLRKELSGLQSTVESLREQNRELQERLSELVADRNYWHQSFEWEQRRYLWARSSERNQPQGLLAKRKTLGDFMEEYERLYPRREKRP